MFDLPKYVFVVVFSEWLDIKEMVLLDSSNCNSAYRNIFMCKIENGWSLCNASYRTSRSPVREKFYRWLGTRKMSLEYLCLT